MPAAELQETGRIPPNAHHSMSEDGCRPCSGLDPSRATIKKAATTAHGQVVRAAVATSDRAGVRIAAGLNDVR